MVRRPFHCLRSSTRKTMRQFRLMSAAIMFAALVTALPTFAQTRPAGTAAATPSPAARSSAPPITGQPAVAANLAGKVAIIDSRAFGDEKEGITRVVNAFKSVSTQFKPMRDDIDNLTKRYAALVEEIRKLQGQGTNSPVEPRSIQQKVDQAEQMKKDIDRKTEDLHNSGQRRLAEVLGPLQEDVFTTMQAFAQQRGISVIIDVSRMAEAFVYVGPSVDVTREFVAEYNRLKPATAAATRP